VTQEGIVGDRRDRLIDVLSLIVALLAFVVSGLAFFRGEMRASRLEKLETANRVFLSEAPQYAATEHPDETWWVVMNTSRVQVTNVWVKGEDQRTVKIWSVQPCSLYALPSGFEPQVLYFEDVYGGWSRTPTSNPEEGGKPLPQKDTDDSPWWMDARNCAS
jgi:hypothetical protein